ncbi:MAG: sulfurtransferase [Acidobacteriaceae bacterium]|nr:sulfurtransferase [Acidobacteriaceae bacterium]
MQERLEISPQELDQRLNSGERVVILDVREPEEFAVAHIAGSVSIPMGSVPNELQRIEAFGDQGDLAVLCHHGVRSLNVTAWLRQRGIENCFSVAGGIDRWSLEVDSSVARY